MKNTLENIYRYYVFCFVKKYPAGGDSDVVGRFLNSELGEAIQLAKKCRQDMSYCGEVNIIDVWTDAEVFFEKK